MSSIPHQIENNHMEVDEGVTANGNTNNLEELPCVDRTETSTSSSCLQVVQHSQCKEQTNTNSNDLEELPADKGVVKYNTTETDNACNDEQFDKVDQTSNIELEKEESISISEDQDHEDNIDSQHTDAPSPNSANKIVTNESSIQTSETESLIVSQNDKNCQDESNILNEDTQKTVEYTDTQHETCTENSNSISNNTEQSQNNVSAELNSKENRSNTSRDFISPGSDPDNTSEDDEENDHSNENMGGKPSKRRSTDEDVEANKRPSKEEKRKKWQLRDLVIIPTHYSRYLITNLLWLPLSWTAFLLNGILMLFFILCDYLKRPGNQPTRKPYSLRSRWSDQDTEQYRKGYPGKKDDKEATKNLHFYKNELPSEPDGDFIDNIHAQWKGNYAKLERHHGYIQWLFPIRESGMNWHAQELQLHEAKAIKEDSKAYKRVRKSYELMLDFYGMKLVDKQTGKLARADNWEERFDNLNRSFHNYLRITRILKSLGELGYEHYQAPFVEFILDEVYREQTLNQRVLSSCVDYWLGTVKDDSAREKLQKRIHDDNLD